MPESLGDDAAALGAVTVAEGWEPYHLEDLLKVGGPLGSGSFGQVTKVVHRKTAEVFAMKVIPKARVEEFEMGSYLQREIKTQLQVQHPNILRLYQYYQDGENFHLLLEYASGGSLFGVLRKRKCLPEPEAARIFADVASALDYLHSLGVVHRDLKPENILMCGDVVKLADFGWCTEGRASALRTTFCGTLDYLSPEMVRDEKHDYRVDIWAVGVLLYELLTGKSPWEASNQMNTLVRITKCDLRIPASISELGGDLIKRLLVDKREDRLPLDEAIVHQFVTQHYIIDASKLKTSKCIESVGSVVAAAEAMEAIQNKEDIVADHESAAADAVQGAEPEASRAESEQDAEDDEEDEVWRRAQEAIKAAEAAEAAQLAAEEAAATATAPGAQPEAVAEPSAAEPPAQAPQITSAPASPAAAVAPAQVANIRSVGTAELAAAAEAEAAEAAAAAAQAVAQLAAQAAAVTFAPEPAKAKDSTGSSARRAAVEEPARAEGSNSQSPSSWHQTDTYRRLQDWITTPRPREGSKDADAPRRMPQTARATPTRQAVDEREARATPQTARVGNSATWRQTKEYQNIRGWLQDNREKNPRLAKLGEELDNLLPDGERSALAKGPGSRSTSDLAVEGSGKQQRRSGVKTVKSEAKIRIPSPLEVSKPPAKFLAVKEWVEEQQRTRRAMEASGGQQPVASRKSSEKPRDSAKSRGSIGSMVSRSSTGSSSSEGAGGDRLGRTIRVAHRPQVPAIPLGATIY